MKKLKIIANNLLFFGVMFLYLMILLFLLIRFDHSGSMRSVNLIPFHSIYDYVFSDNQMLNAFAFSNVLGNIVLFIPLGVYLTYFVPNKNILLNTAIIAGLSVLVEVIQYIFAVGVTDIDDVILNTIGGLLGVLLYRLILFLFKEKTKFAIEIFAPIGGVAVFVIFCVLN